MNKENISFWQNDLKKKSGGFSMPPSYFDDFDEQLMDVISNQNSDNQTKEIKVFYNWLYAAVAVAAILTISVFLFSPNHSNNFDALLQAETAAVDIDQFAVFEESWIIEELENSDLIDEDTETLDEIDFLLIDGITTNEIMEIIAEQK